MTAPYKMFLPFFILLSLAMFTVLYWWGYLTPNIGIDEANTYFVYMRNLANGDGFTWTPGGEKIEGFTSLLWTLIGSVCYLVSPAYLPQLLMGISGVFTFLTLSSTLRFARKLNHTENKRIALTDIIILTLLFIPLGFVEWQILSLMESALWTFLLVHITLQLCNYFIYRKISMLRFCMLLVLLNLTRPESILYNILFILLLIMIAYLDNGMKLNYRKIILPSFVHGVTVVILAIWRFKNSGYLLPNTFYANISFSPKSNLSGGLRYLRNFFYSYPHVAVIIAILSFFTIAFLFRLKYMNLRAGLTNREQTHALLFLVILSGLALPVISGGDHFPHSRFYQPFLPIIYLAVTHRFLWKRYEERFKKISQAWILTVTLLALVILYVSTQTIFKLIVNRGDLHSYGSGMIRHFKNAEVGRETAEKLNQVFASRNRYPSVGTLCPGGVGYIYKGETIDLLGNNNTKMAHATSTKEGYINRAAFDRKGFWIVTPDVMGAFWGADVLADTSGFVIPENTQQFRNADPMYMYFKGIFDDRAFREAYFPALVKNKKVRYFVFAYYKDTFLQSLETDNFTITRLERKGMSN